MEGGAVGESGEVFGAEGLVCANAVEVELGGGEREAEGDGDQRGNGEGGKESGPEVGAPHTGTGVFVRLFLGVCQLVQLLELCAVAFCVSAFCVCPGGAAEDDQAEDYLGDSGEAADEVAVFVGGEVVVGEDPEDKEGEEESAEECEEVQEGECEGIASGALCSV